MTQTPQNNSRLGSVVLIVVGGIIALSLYGWWRTAHRAEPDEPVVLATITVAELADMLVKGERILIYDIRSKNDYLSKHIPDAVSLPYYEISFKGDELESFRDWSTILVCENDSCPGMETATRDLRLAGYTNLKRLEGGIAAYEQADLTLASQAKLIQDDLIDVLTSFEVPEMTVDELTKKKDEPDIFIVDTRTPFEFVTGFIPGAIDIPLHAIAAAMEQELIPRDKTLVLYDRKGNRSRIAVQALLDAGYKNVFNLTGGIDAWNTANLDLALPNEDGSDLTTLIPVLGTE